MSKEQIEIVRDDNAIPVAGIVKNGSPFPDYTPPSWDSWFMGLVYDTARKSKDLSTKIGAVIVKDKRPILFGYNGIPQKVKDTPERMERPKKYKWTEHGERNAIFCGARFGIATDGTTMYTQALPCCECARAIVNSGISKVIIHKESSDIFAASSHYSTTWKEDHEISTVMFQEAGVELVTLNVSVGKWSFIGGKVYVV